MAYAAGCVFIVLVLGSFFLLFFSSFSSDDFCGLTIVQSSVITAVDDLPVVVDADQVIVCNEGEV